ncbi:MAG TPA: hypothetical protein PLD84_00865 [Chitinophagales bacterium]|nr:hypothetical protein [Chitinophagales bacterium]
MMFGFLITFPSVLFWCLVVYGKLSNDHTYLDAILSCGGTFCDIMLKGLFPFFSLLIAFICNKTLQQQAIAQNVWHRETRMMRANRNLINWNAMLILVMILSFINN